MFDRNKSIFFDTEPTVTNERVEGDLATDTLVLSLVDQKVRSYGVSIKYYDTDGHEPDRRLDYEIQVTITPHEEHAGLWQLSFHKSQLLINRRKPDLVSEELAAYLMEALNPIRVTVNKYNVVQDGLENHTEIMQRWPTIKQRILEKYEGAVTDRLLETFEEKLSNRWLLTYALEKDMFWKAFFAPVYGTYGQNLQRMQELVFPIRHKRFCHFKGQQVIKSRKTDYDTYKVSMVAKGKQHEAIKMDYDLDADSGLLRFMLIEGLEDEKRFLRFSAYQIDKDQDGENIAIVEEKEPVTYPKKRGFWGLFR